MNRQQTINKAIAVSFQDTREDTRQDIKGIFDCTQTIDGFAIFMHGYECKGEIFSFSNPIIGNGKDLKRAKTNFLKRFLIWSKRQYNITNLHNLKIEKKIFNIKQWYGYEKAKHCGHHWERIDRHTWANRKSLSTKRQNEIKTSIKWNGEKIDNDFQRYERIENKMDCGFTGMKRGKIDPMSGQYHLDLMPSPKRIRDIKDRRQIASIKAKYA